jgi:hypothetical protein
MNAGSKLIWAVGVSSSLLVASARGASANPAPPVALGPVPGSPSVRAATPEVTPPAPASYVIGLVGTTLSHRPRGGEFVGPQKDLAPSLGFGRFVTASVALELDVGLAFGPDGYLATSVTPGVVWAFHANLYAAGRAIVLVHPEPNVVLFPGVGALHMFDSGLAPFFELNLSSAVGRGEPDLGAAASLGALYAF